MDIEQYRCSSVFKCQTVNYSLCLIPSIISEDELFCSSSLNRVFNALIGSQFRPTCLSSPSPFHSQLKSLTLILPLPYLPPPSTSSTIAFLIADKSILIFALGLHFSNTLLLKSGEEYARRNSVSFGCNFFIKSISAGVSDDEFVTAVTGKLDLDADVRKFSNSRSNDDARFLNDFALSFINCRSASVESFTSLHPFDMNENAFSAVTAELVAGDVRVSAGLKLIIVLTVGHDSGDS
ncbi:hypothetical protein HanRHA438_Chr11g0523701 [Helianthus annuus]|nr:hypothetical protein HanRHA438_Chr11g0523701 [Helianthus annuus]